MFFFSIVEAIATGLIFVYVQRTDPTMFHGFSKWVKSKPNKENIPAAS